MMRYDQAMRPAEHRSRALQTAIAVVLVAALLFAFALATFLPANDDSLRVHLATLETSASEGLTLARADDEERVPRHFYDTEMELLRKDAEKTSKSLVSARPLVELRPRFAEAAWLAGAAARDLAALGKTGALKESVIAAQATLGAVKARAKAMDQELGP